MNFHTTVLLKESIEYLDPQIGDIMVDATLGGGGHALAIAKRIEPSGRLIALDLDPESIRVASEKFVLEKCSAEIILKNENYKNIDCVLSDLQIEKVDGIIADIGVSSYDFESSGRGFSFQKDELLDMRFNPADSPANKKYEPFTARFILGRYSEQELNELFSAYGEEKFSKRIARAIVSERQNREIATTIDLFDLIKKSLPGAIRFKAADSARRIFQALRIEVNKELANLEEFLPKAFEALKPGGRLLVISFHSLEDRIVKQYFLKKAQGCICPKEFPVCICGKTPEGKVLTHKPITASAEEVNNNSRSKPAKLRVIEKI